MGRNRCAPRVTAQAGIVGPPTLRLHQRTTACPSWARGLLSAQWKPGYHGPACQGPQHRSENFAKDQALQAWRASRGFSPRRGISPREGTKTSRQGSSQKVRRGFQPRGDSFPPSRLCLLDRAHMGSAPSAESRARQSAMTTALSLPFSCIKQSTKQRQAKELQGLPFWCKETVCRSAPRATSPWGAP